MEQPSTMPASIGAHGTNSEFVYGKHQFDILIESIIHPYFIVTADGNILNMNNAAGKILFSECSNFFALTTSCIEKVGYCGNARSGRGSERMGQKMSIWKAMPWLAEDFETFIRSEMERETVLKKISGDGQAEYQIRFSRVISTGDSPADATISLLKTSDVNRQPHMTVEQLKTITRKIRKISHDMSQPIMIMGGYYDLIEIEAPETPKRQLDKNLNCAFSQVKKLQEIHNRLREIVKLLTG